MDIIHSIRLRIAARRAWKAYKALRNKVEDAYKRLALLKRLFSELEISRELTEATNEGHACCRSIIQRLDQYEGYLAEGRPEDAQYVFSFVVPEYRKLQNTMHRMEELLNDC